MEDVTDAAFRRLIARYGKPDVMFTEFTSADGLVLAPTKGQKSLRRKLLFSESERPIVAQLFTSSPDRMEKAALIVRELGFDGVDINMGCPDRAVEKSGCGAALMKNPRLARELIRAAARSELPVSVKTRIGYDKNELETWLPELLGEKPSAITIHARTRKEMSDVPAHWDAIARAVLIRDTMEVTTLIIGNGDVQNIKDAHAKANAASCDGVMLGRAIYGSPWLFSYSHELDNSIVTPKDRMETLSEHLELFEKLLSDSTNYATMKKHFNAYICGWDNAKKLRMRLMETEKSAEAKRIIADAIMRS